MKKTTAMVDEGAAAATKDEGGVCRQPCGRGSEVRRQTRPVECYGAWRSRRWRGSDDEGDSMECDGRRRRRREQRVSSVMTDEGGDLVERETMMAI